MSKNEKQYTIYLRSTKESIPVSKEEFDAYYKDINAYRRTQMNHGKCVCPSGMWLTCDMDCMDCPFARAGDSRSLDHVDYDEEGNETSWVDEISTGEPLLEEIIEDANEMQALFDRLIELMPEAIQIGELRLDGMDDRNISKEIGIARSTFEGRIARVKKILKSEFPDFF